MVSQCEGWKSGVAEREIEFVLEKINKATRNESAWNYLRVKEQLLNLKKYQIPLSELSNSYITNLPSGLHITSIEHLSLSFY